MFKLQVSFHLRCDSTGLTIRNGVGWCTGTCTHLWCCGAGIAAPGALAGDLVERWCPKMEAGASAQALGSRAALCASCAYVTRPRCHALSAPHHPIMGRVCRLSRSSCVCRVSPHQAGRGGMVGRWAGAGSYLACISVPQSKCVLSRRTSWGLRCCFCSILGWALVITCCCEPGLVWSSGAGVRECIAFRLSTIRHRLGHDHALGPSSALRGCALHIGDAPQLRVEQDAFLRREV